METTNKILIFSGEGERGTWEVYNGKKTERAIKARLTRERCNGDRWAEAWNVIAENKDYYTLKSVFDSDTRQLLIDEVLN